LKNLRETLNAPVSLTWSIVGIAALLLFGWGWYSSGLLLNVGRLPNTVLPGAFGLEFEELLFASPDGIPLSGWFIPGEAGSEATVIVCHGWGANKSDVLPSTAFLRRRGGYNLFYFDFRNHGDSGGNKSSLTTMEVRDLESAVAHLRKEKPAAARRIGVYGMSMGGAVALTTTARRPEIQAVAAESPFSSFNETVVRFAKLFYGVPRVPLVQITLFFIRARLGLDPEKDAPIHHVDKISPRPVFFIQGGSDRRMPVTEGELLFARAKEPKELWTIPDADHGEVSQIAGRRHEDRLLDFFRRAFSEEDRSAKR
jgi:uncharacterized protein